MPETFTFAPDRSSKRSNAPRMKRVQFGNGYVQKWGDGINSNLEKWDMVFTANSADELAYLENFFTDNYLTCFFWRRPDGTFRAYECVVWDITELGANNYTVTAVFSEWAGLYTLPVTASDSVYTDLGLFTDGNSFTE